MPLSSDLERLRGIIAANPGMTDEQVAALVNAPEVVGTAYREITQEEFYATVSALGKARLALALESVASANQETAQAEAAAAAALYERLTLFGVVDVTPSTPGRAELDAAVSDYGLSAADHAALVALGSSDVQQSLREQWGWSEDVRALDVARARAQNPDLEVV